MDIIKNKLIGLDTNIFIYYFQQNRQFGEKAKRIFNYLVDNKIKAITSVITLIELLSLPVRDEKNIDKLKNLFLETPNLEIQDINQEIGILSARIRRNYNFRIPDSIQLATCLYKKIDIFITNDFKLKAFKEFPIILL